MPEITITRVSDSTFTVVSNQELKPGEYLLTFDGAGTSGWDFGVRNEWAIIHSSCVPVAACRDCPASD